MSKNGRHKSDISVQPRASIRGNRSISRSILNFVSSKTDPPLLRFTGRIFFMWLNALLRFRRALSIVLSAHRYSHILSFDRVFSSISISASICAFLKGNTCGSPSIKSSGVPKKRTLYFTSSHPQILILPTVKYDIIRQHFTVINNVTT